MEKQLEFARQNEFLLSDLDDKENELTKMQNMKIAALDGFLRRADEIEAKSQNLFDNRNDLYSNLSNLLQQHEKTKKDFSQILDRF